MISLFLKGDHWSLTPVVGIGDTDWNDAKTKNA